jgi:hypothetical protein
VLIAAVLVGGLGYVAWHDVYGGREKSVAPAPPAAPPPPAPLTPAEATQNAIARLPVQTIRPVPPRESECVRLAGSRAAMNTEALKVFGTVVSGANSTAILASGKSKPETVQVGDYVGSHCWRVSSIEDDSITLSSAAATPQTTKVEISAQPQAPARKEHHRRR